MAPYVEGWALKLFRELLEGGKTGLLVVFLLEGYCRGKVSSGRGVGGGGKGLEDEYSWRDDGGRERVGAAGRAVGGWKGRLAACYVASGQESVGGGIRTR